MGSYQPAHKKIKLMAMDEKSPISILQEFCVQEKFPYPEYEIINNENDIKLFDCTVFALKLYGRGYGRSKAEAKQNACVELINVLSQMDQYKNKILRIDTVIPQNNNNAVGELISLCMQRNWNVPRWEERLVNGEPHKREFTYACFVGNNECTGKGLTKKSAQRMAAEKMLKLLNDMPADRRTKNDDFPNPVPIIDLPSVEEILAEYRRLKAPHIKPVPCSLRKRSNFFLELPEDDQSEARKILMEKSAMFATDAEMVHLVCTALNLKYEIVNKWHYKIFSLIDCDYDCVIADSAGALFEKVIDFFKIMLNV